MPSDFIPLSEPRVAGREWEYVKECLDTGWVSSVGSFVDRFEREVAARVDAAHAVACASGTAALHMALHALGIGPGDEVVVPAITFIASANSVRYVGAYPVFVDTEPRYLQLDLGSVESFLVEGCERRESGLHNRATGRRVRAIMPVHVLGHPSDMAAITEIAGRHGLDVVEDATEALGSTLRGRPVGAMGRVGCFSFNGNKILTTGSGGMVVTNDAPLAARIRHLTTQAKRDAVEFVHDEVGWNYRLSNVSAAIGVAQLEMLDDAIARKREIARRYAEGLHDLDGLGLPIVAPWASSNRWLYAVRTRGADSRELMKRLRGVGIESRPIWQPLHRSPAHVDAFAWRVTQADEIHRELLCLPSSSGLNEQDQARVIAAVRAVIRA